MHGCGSCRITVKSTVPSSNRPCVIAVVHSSIARQYLLTLLNQRRTRLPSYMLQSEPCLQLLQLTHEPLPSSFDTQNCSHNWCQVAQTTLALKEGFDPLSTDVHQPCAGRKFTARTSGTRTRSAQHTAANFRQPRPRQSALRPTQHTPRAGGCLPQGRPAQRHMHKYPVYSKTAMNTKSALGACCCRSCEA